MTTVYSYSVVLYCIIISREEYVLIFSRYYSNMLSDYCIILLYKLMTRAQSSSELMRASAAELAIVHQARAGLSVLRRTRDDRRRLVRPQRVRAALATEVAHEHLARVRLRQPRLVARVLLPLARLRARLRRPAPRVGRRQP